MEKNAIFLQKMKNKNILININLTRKMNFFEEKNQKILRKWFNVRR